ncbi:MAG: type II secretion system F family protein [Eggerthellaceae bacterium]|nr:type II secretion system F family protein [Eggerthellaceae bacterium]
MDAVNILALASCISAFAATLLLSSRAFDALQSHSRLSRLQQRAVMRSNFPLFEVGITGFNQLALRILEYPIIARYCTKLCRALQQSGMRARTEAVLSVLMAFLALILLLFALIGRVVLGLLCGYGLIFGIGVWAARVQEKRAQHMRDALPDAFSAMSSCFGAGFTLLQTFSHLEHELPAPLSQLFSQAAASLNAGFSPADVLSRLRDESGLPELSFIAVALAVQHQSGGSMQRVLDATRESVKEEVELRQSLRIHTAQAKLSARVVVGVTIGLVGAMMLLSPAFLAPFFRSVFGLGLLVCAIGMQVLGIVLVRHLLHVEVEPA